MRGSNRSGLSLVELLVVIGVVGILAALLLAAVSQAKARALRIQCGNNVRQLGLALQEYQTEHDFYPAFLDPSDHSENRYWKSALGNELGIHTNSTYFPKGIWHCPAANRPSNSIWNLHKEIGYNDYGYNAYGLGSTAFTNSLGLSTYFFHNLPTPRVNLSQVASPDELFAIGDAFLGGPDVIEDGLTILGRASDGAVLAGGYSFSDPESTKRSYGRHQAKANVAFCDGHVESPKLQFLFQDISDDALSCWNRDHQPHRELLQP
jgi:prepilin-type processing-associated H-X9-DG protein/prepilin-type N-terminal cleavage/methylation domain-containing protein